MAPQSPEGRARDVLIYQLREGGGKFTEIGRRLGISPARVRALYAREVKARHGEQAINEVATPLAARVRDLPLSTRTKNGLISLAGRADVELAETISLYRKSLAEAPREIRDVGGRILVTNEFGILGWGRKSHDELVAFLQRHGLWDESDGPAPRRTWRDNPEWTDNAGKRALKVIDDWNSGDKRVPRLALLIKAAIQEAGSR